MRLGVEIGLEKPARQANADFIKRAPFDMVIGSIHLVERLDIYYPDYYADKDKDEA